MGTTLTNPTGLINLHPQNPPPLFPFPATERQHYHHFPNPQQIHTSLNNPWESASQSPNPSFLNQNPLHIKHESLHLPPPPPISSSPFFQPPLPPTHKSTLISSPFQNLHGGTQPTSAHLSATALLQKAASVGAQPVGQVANRLDTSGTATRMSPEYLGFTLGNLVQWQKSNRLTRDFLGLTTQCGGGGSGGGDGGGNGGSTSNGSTVDVNVNVRNLLTFTGGSELPTTYERDHTMLKAQCFGFAEPPVSEAWGNC